MIEKVEDKEQIAQGMGGQVVEAVINASGVLFRLRKMTRTGAEERLN